MSFSCVLIGQESLLVGCGEAILDAGHTVRAVVSDDPEILAWARRRELAHAEKITELNDMLAPAEVDWILSIANLKVIPDSVLALAGKGAVNFHDGPLPRYAGLNTPVWALMAGEERYGVSWHVIEGGIDEGDILAQSMFDIAADDTAFSLNSKCYAAAMDSFPSVVTQLDQGLQRQPQDLSQRSYFGRDHRPAAFGVLDLHQAADALTRQVRALDFGGYWNPLTAAKLATANSALVVGTASKAGRSGALPGTVLEIDADGVVVATGDGDLRLSGLTALDGGAVDIGAQFTANEKLPLLDAAQTEALTTAQQNSLRAEPGWRRQLKQLHVLPCPLAKSAAGSAWSAQRISMPFGISADDAAVAVLVWALGSSGEGYGDVGLTTPALQAAATSGFLSPWVPMRAASDTSLGDLRTALADQIAKAAEKGGFARDLPARDPAITATGVPAIALAIDGAAPLAGSLMTVSISGDSATLQVADGVLDGATTELLLRRLEWVLQGIGQADPGADLGSLSCLPMSERSCLLKDWNATAVDYDRELTVHGAFEAQVAKTPALTALVCEDQSVTYAELNQRANQIAAALTAQGVQPGAHVGLYLSRSIDLVAGALGIFKAGAAYVPLDPGYPADRITHYITDSTASVIITRTDMKADLPVTDATALCVDTLSATDDAGNVDAGATASHLAYLIYTSGSTGTPKGVMVEHRNVINFFIGMDARIDHAEGDTWMAVTSLNFDISVLELFWTLARGFRVILSSDENRAVVSNGPIAVSDRHIDFNLMYWGNDDGQGPKKYELLLEGAKFASANGFNAVWTPERHFHAFGGPYPNPAVTGAAVAAVAPNLSVRAGSCVAPLHHPARIAEDWAVIDNLTGGRAAIGFASGWQPDDFILRPENAPPKNKPAMFEAIETVRKLWRGETVGFPRADGSIHSIVTQPRPVSAELPVWVTTAGNPETWREAGRVGANVLTHLLGQSIDEVADKIRIYHAALRESGHDPANFRVTLMLHSYLAETREAARDIAREPMKDYLRSAAGLIKQYAWAFPAFKKPEGVSNPFEMDLGSLSEGEMEAILDFAFERYFEDSGLFGTVEDGLARIEQVKRIGVDEVACLIDYGIDPTLVLEGLKPIAEVLRRANAPSELAEDDFSLAAQIIRHDVTHLQCTPSMARIIAMNTEAQLALGKVRHLMLGGEALPGELVEDLREYTGAQIQNMYGPTETTIWSTNAKVAAGARGIVDVGTPIANTAVYVVDDRGEPCPVGVPGELLIGGEGVTRGYWQRPELNEERFPLDGFAAEAGLTRADNVRLYRTGDLVRWRQDGRLDFLGRTDHQVKIRGQRIELGEIEAEMSGFDGVSGAVVIARPMAAGDLRLVGYITTRAPVAEAALREHLAATLPEVMVPAHIVTLDEFPLTPNKKIDRKALPEPSERKVVAASTSSEPVTGLEAKIAEIWSRILGVGNIRSDDNFFALGGHSLLAVQAHREIRETLNLPQLSITDIFRFPTLGALADHVSDGEPEPAAPVVDEAARSDAMSKRRAMRANRRDRS